VYGDGYYSSEVVVTVATVTPSGDVVMGCDNLDGCRPTASGMECNGDNLSDVVSESKSEPDPVLCNLCGQAPVIGRTLGRKFGRSATI
jgi:hypothetical protein